MIEKAWKDADRNLVPRLFRAISKETVNHILPSEKSLNRQHEMEYYVMRFVAVLHNWRVGEHVTSERATEASLPSLPLVSLALHSFHSGSYRHHRCVARENWPFVNFCLLFRFIMKNVTNIQEVVSVVRGENSEYLREHCKCETTVEVYPHWRQETNKPSESLS